MVTQYFKNDYNDMKAHIEKISDNGIDTKFKASCQSCSHEWESEVDLDMSNFSQADSNKSAA